MTLLRACPQNRHGGTNEKGNQERSVSEIPYLRQGAGGRLLEHAEDGVRAVVLRSRKRRAWPKARSPPLHPSVSISLARQRLLRSCRQSPTVTVSGTASDGVGLSSLSLNGKAVTVGAGGAWSIPVTLAPGTNILTATATNQAGLATSAAISVTYALPPAKAAIVGSVSGHNGKIRLTLGCNGLAGQTCQVQVLGTTLERLRGHRILFGVGAHAHAHEAGDRGLRHGRIPGG